MAGNLSGLGINLGGYRPINATRDPAFGKGPIDAGGLTDAGRDSVGVPTGIVGELEGDCGSGPRLGALLACDQLADYLGLCEGRCEEKTGENQTVSYDVGHGRAKSPCEQTSGPFQALNIRSSREGKMATETGSQGGIQGSCPHRESG